MSVAVDEVRRLRERAASPDTPLGELICLARRFPERVLANPALELALVADPGVFAAASPVSLRALARQPSADGALLSAIANACFDQYRSHGSVIDAVAARADAPRSVLARVAGWAGNRCTADGREVARYRMLTGIESCAGWDAAIMPSLPWFVRVRNRPVAPRCAVETVSGLFAHRLIRLECPMVRAILLMMEAPLRRAALLAGPRDDLTWLHAVARAEHYGGKAGGAAEHIRWRFCMAAWYSADPWCLFPPRDNAHGFADGMGRQMLARRILETAERWLAGDVDDIRRIASSPVGQGQGQGSASVATAAADPAAPTVPSADAVIKSAAGDAAPTVVQLLLLTSPACPLPLLARRSRSATWVVRAAVACNPALPARERDVLREDLHWIVRGAARGAPTARETWSAAIAKGA